MPSGQTLFRVAQIDHVELFVPDKREAADWYRRVLGLEIVPECEGWSTDSGGPLMISSDGGSTKLALFQGPPQAARPTAGFHRVAFRVSAEDFLRFLQRAAELELKDERERRVTVHLAVDHQLAYSIYFTDLYGHRLEVTTYEHDAVRAALNR